MTKNNLFLFTILFFFLSSCSNNPEPGSSKSEKTPAEEQRLRDQVNKFPDSLLPKENLIQYFRDNSNYSQAITETENALKKDSLNERLWYIKATLFTENEDTLQAIKAWEKVIRLNPMPEYIMSLGTLYAFSKNPLALAMADSLLANPKANAEKQAIFIKGLYFSSIGEKEKAVGFFDKCITLDYTNLMAYREKAVCFYDMGKYVDALKVLELALAVNKAYDEAYYWMGRCYEKLNLKKEATENYQMALQISPDYVEAKDALAKLGVAP